MCDLPLVQVAQAFDDASHVEHHVLDDFFGARDDSGLVTCQNWGEHGFITHTAAQFGSASGEKKWDGLRKSLTLRIDEF